MGSSEFHGVGIVQTGSLAYGLWEFGTGPLFMTFISPVLSSHNVYCEKGWLDCSHILQLSSESLLMLSLDSTDPNIAVSWRILHNTYIVQIIHFIFLHTA